MNNMKKENIKQLRIGNYVGVPIPDGINMGTINPCYEIAVVKSKNRNSVNLVGYEFPLTEWVGFSPVEIEMDEFWLQMFLGKNTNGNYWWILSDVIISYNPKNSVICIEGIIPTITIEKPMSVSEFQNLFYEVKGINLTINN